MKLRSNLLSWLKSKTYLKSEVDNKFDEIRNLVSGKLSRSIVSELPSAGEHNVIYMILNEEQAEDNIYDEYLFVNNEWELIGSTAVDLSDYMVSSDYETAILTVKFNDTTIQMYNIVVEKND